MSTTEATLRGAISFKSGSVIAGSLAVVVVRIKEAFGIDQPSERAVIASANTLTTDDTTTNWLVSIVGTFDGDSFYERVIENMRAAERSLCEEYRGVE